ncbi:hypothetical protein HCN44_002605 [Aphidius gifuensis]|uniref:MH2 domain-containing protein n=1 Tax=Aphidius gifuensis TaxID=684658 RepID=A0A835CUE7_APHGI|nr:hypothetical protein HCN44_002605 [Aphidius gifuensis]
MGFRKLKKKIDTIKKLLNISKEKLDDTDKIDENKEIKSIIDSLLNTIELESIFDNLLNIKKPQNWLTIKYYEKNYPTGEFKSNSRIITVDNNAKSSIDKDKFCVANLKGKFTTNEKIKNTKELIGKGVKINFDGNNVIIVNNSTTNLFVHSLGINKLYGRSDNSVQRVPPENTAVIFRKSIFQQLLFNHLREGDKSIRDLYAMCKIRISFKTSRNLGDSSVIPDVPCWLELQLNIPRGILDSIILK